MEQGPRVAVIGLDCATPSLLFDDLQAEVPTIAALMRRGMYGNLASITPPITVPAWACAMTGKTPGQLGIYGFRNRKDASYGRLSIAHAGSIQEPAVWDALGQHGMRSVLIGVPPSFPPPIELPGLARRVLPDAALGGALGVPAGPRGRDRRGARRRRPVHLRHPELPDGRVRRDARSGVQDDRAAVPGGAAADREQAVGLLHGLRHRAGPAAPRVLAVLRPDAPALRARQQVRDRLPGVLPRARQGARVVRRADPRRRRDDRDERPRRAPDDGRPVLQRLADPGALPRRSPIRSPRSRR